MWDFLYAVKRSDVIKSIDTWGKTSVEAEDLVVDECSERKIIEEICEVFPYVGIAVFSEAFIVEAINLGDLAGLMVTAEDCDALGISYFESNEEGDRLYRVVSSINVVAWKLCLAMSSARASSQGITYP